MKITRSNLLFALAISLVGAVIVLGKTDAQAQAAVETWEVEVNVFSGRPNPVFTLTASEAADVISRLATARSVAGASANVKTIRPSILGYRGLTIVGKSSDGTRVTGDIEVYRGKSLRRVPAPAAVLEDGHVGVERMLLGLGVAKKAVSPELMAKIQKDLP